MNNQTIIEELEEAFPEMFINKLQEVIIEPENNIYFRLEDCDNKRDVMIKLFNYCSRLKEMSLTAKCYLLGGINWFCGTKLSYTDMHHIYTVLGNGINNELTQKFVDSKFDMSLIPQEIPSWFKGDKKQFETHCLEE